MGESPVQEWASTYAPVRRSLELAHQALRAGGLPVGAVIVDASANVIAEGRNRCYDPPGGDDPLQGTPLAHAELNALARIATNTDLSTSTLWSTHRPCLMCAAACEFTGVGGVRFLAPDPSDDSADPGSAHPRSAHPETVDDRWAVLANVLFLEGISRYSGPDAPMISRARVREPETAALLATVGPLLFASAELEPALVETWAMIAAAAQARAARRRR
jgi:tRNA(Arg) A34 adenosine deaminase TadA